MKNNKLSTLLIILLIAGIQSGCYYDQIPSPSEIDREVSFSGDILSIFNSSCNSAGCHNTGGIKPDLTSAKALEALTGEGYINSANPEQSILYQVMIGTGSLMPPSGKLGPTDINLVLAWIEQGAQNN